MCVCACVDQSCSRLVISLVGDVEEASIYVGAVKRDKKQMSSTEL